MIQDLYKLYPWPEIKPELPQLDKGWFTGHEFLKEHLDENAQIVVELGSWLGKSAKFFLNQCPNAFVIAVDHWKGSREHQIRFESLLPNLYETFLVNCWDFKDRLIPLKASTIEGLREIHRSEVEPNFIYIDASHFYEDVLMDITISIVLFPNAKIGGDDWLWGKRKPVRQAAEYCAKCFKKKIEVSGNNWIYI